MRKYNVRVIVNGLIDIRIVNDKELEQIRKNVRANNEARGWSEPLDRVEVIKDIDIEDNIN